MNKFTGAFALTLLLISSTAVLAQQTPQQADEFSAFRAKLNAAKNAPPQPAPILVSVVTPGSETVPVVAPTMPAAESRVITAEMLKGKADGVPVQSKISDVTVYGNGARVTRVATLEILKGAQNIIFTDLPPSFAPDSLRVEGTAIAQVKLGAVTDRVIASPVAPPKDNTTADKILKLQDDQRALAAETTALNKKRDFLDGLMQRATANPPPESKSDTRLSPDQWGSAADTVYTAMADVLKKLHEQDIKDRDFTTQIQRLQLQSTSSLSHLNDNLHLVIVPVEADKATKLTLKLSYRIAGAGWQPLYDARLDTSDDAKLQLTQYGSVHQATGEDWNDVQLTLSTARPERGIALPALSTRWVDLYAPGGISADQVRMNSVSTFGGAPPEASLQEWRAKAEARRISLENQTPPPEEKNAPPEQAATAPAAINTGGFLAEYEIPGPATVKKDGTDSKLMIGSFDLESKIETHVRPQLNTSAFTVVSSILKGDSPILAGKANLFRNDAFIGQTSLPLLRPGEKNDISFGIDDSIAVNQKEMRDEAGQQGIISKDSTRERHVLTEIQNLRKEPAEIVVEEIIPASKNENIHITLDTAATTEGFEKDANNTPGLLKWRLTLPEKAKQEIKLGYSISWPKDSNISGL